MVASVPAIVAGFPITTSNFFAVGPIVYGENRSIPSNIINVNTDLVQLTCYTNYGPFKSIYCSADYVYG